MEIQHTLTAHHPSLPARLLHARHDPADGNSSLPTRCSRTAEGDEITVGTSIHVEHRVASGIGTRVRGGGGRGSIGGKLRTPCVFPLATVRRRLAEGRLGVTVVSVAKFRPGSRRGLCRSGARTCLHRQPSGATS